MSDRARVLARLREAGSRGVHSHDLRRDGYSGNPSQRCNELEEEGHTIERRRESRNGRPGVRFILTNLDAEGSLPCPPERSVKPVPGEREAQPIPAASASLGHIFDVPEKPSEGVPAPSAYDPWSEAA